MKESKEISKGYKSVDKMFEDLNKERYFVNIYLINGEETNGSRHKTKKEALKSVSNSLLKKYYIRTDEVIKQNETKP